MLLGWRVTRPAEALTDAAVRLGQGDFATSIPTAGPAEIGQLARTMDDMRRNLVDLNSELRHREAEAQVVLEAVVEGVYAVDQERNIRYLNPQAARLLGVEAGEAIGKFCGDVLKPCGPPGSPRLAALRDHGLPDPARAPGRQRAGGGTAADHAPATARPSSPVRASSTACRCRCCATRPNSRACAARATPCSPTSSHEFRTPLAAQLASIELLREGLKTSPPEKLEELVLSLERGTLRLTRLIDNLLESVRIESGQLDVRRQSIELADVVDDARGAGRSAAAAARPAARSRRARGPRRCRATRTRLTQVFVNLIANASKFAPEGTAVRVGARVDGDQISAWVEDSGPGLARRRRDRHLRTLQARRFSGARAGWPGAGAVDLALDRRASRRHASPRRARAEGYTRFTITLPART